MRKLPILITALITLFFFACSEDSDFQDASTAFTDEIAEVNSATAEYSANAETAVATSLEEVDLIIDEGLDQYFRGLGKGRYGLLECAEVTVDTAANTMTVDFGDGCEDMNGVVRSGMIILERSGDKLEIGSFHKVTFQAFTVDSVQIDGVRTSTNITDTAAVDGLEVTQVVLTGGVITFNDTVSITRESELTRTRFRGDLETPGYTSLTGSASGTLNDGTAYTSTIVDEIYMTRECDLHVPVSGVKDLVAGDLTAELDYGDGTCDNLATLTINGESTEIELEARKVGEGRPHSKRGHGDKGRKGGKDHKGDGDKGPHGDGECDTDIDG